ncbi:MAG: polysaccharide deacetylase family protein [Cyclobacteriaceae bacterium]
MEKINRRNFIQKSAIFGGMNIAGINSLPFSEVIGNGRNGQEMANLTTYIASYDTESQSCIDNLETIVNMHKKHNMPATFFIVSNILNTDNKSMVKELLDDPLFEIASHSFSHRVVLDHPVCGMAKDPSKEIIESKKILEDIFGKEIIGFRTPCGYPEGLRGEIELLELVGKAGYQYISTMLWGPGFSLPADIVESFSYEKEGFKEIWEIPGHGWHENVLKGHSKIHIPLAVWPTKWPEVAIPKQYLETPKEEFDINRYFIDTAIEKNIEHITFIWHPWSLGRFDKEMKMLDLTFTYINEIGIKTDTFEGFYKTKDSN